MPDIIDQIPILSKRNVQIKNKDKLNDMLLNISKGGLKKLQIVFDFDKTITKQHEDGVPHLSSFAIFSKIPSCLNNEKYQETVRGLRLKYYPIEMDPHIPVKDKIELMEEWWNLSEKAISGLKLTQKDIDEVCLDCKPALREGCKEFFSTLNKAKVPVLVFSAGCGDIVLTILQQSNVFWPNVKVISNFLNFHDDGTITGFKDKPIHVFNKNEYAIKNTDFYNLVEDRNNAIVLGDSLGDASMAQGMEHCQNVLKIGFLYEHIEDALPQYLDTFDIVLVDDQTMDVPRAVFDFIRNYHC
ncbi:hypothetical protein ABEB36_004364 [Hypothenemus hampei]|uniref:5'-nucleotidase n=1 Tax=Hypothenemus hampei TaxID=57062 RepID=A0ABD1F326_HYPHA